LLRRLGVVGVLTGSGTGGYGVEDLAAFQV
jgi:hypothetical protein